MKLYSIWDIDNCLADDSARQSLVDWDEVGDARYDRYNLQAAHDPLFHRAEFELMLKLGATPVFFTGRPEKHRRLTLTWLHRALGLSFPRMYMRPDGTVGLTPRTLKEQMLKEFQAWMAPDERIVAAFDDLDAVVQMYRSHGIPAAKLIIHEDVSKVYQPSDLK